MLSLNDETDINISDATPSHSESNNLVMSILSVPTVNKPTVEIIFNNDLMNFHIVQDDAVTCSSNEPAMLSNTPMETVDSIALTETPQDNIEKIPFYK